MIEIHVADVEGLARTLASARDPKTDLDTLAENVRRVAPLAERLTTGARARTRYPVRSVRDAVLLLGCRGVEEHARALAAWWLQALERPGGARIVDPSRLPPPHADRRLARAG
jgi:hypothetical protein